MRNDLREPGLLQSPGASSGNLELPGGASLPQTLYCSCYHLHGNRSARPLHLPLPAGAKALLTGTENLPHKVTTGLKAVMPELSRAGPGAAKAPHHRDGNDGSSWLSSLPLLPTLALQCCLLRNTWKSTESRALLTLGREVCTAYRRHPAAHTFPDHSPHSQLLFEVARSWPGGGGY